LNDGNVGKTHLEQGARGERGFSAAAAGQYDLLPTILKRGIAAFLLGVRPDFKLAPRDVAGARYRSALAELPFFADVDERDAATVEQHLGVAGGEDRNVLAGFVDTFAKGFSLAHSRRP